MPTLHYEEELQKGNPRLRVVGLDEVGCASFAGPLVAGAVYLGRTEKPWFKEVNDSKVLSKPERERLSELIKQSTVWAVGSVTSKEVDKLGVFKARVLAMRRALRLCILRLPRGPVGVIVDDERLSKAEFVPIGVYINKADELSVSVAAASVVAKVARDKYMEGLARLFPGYSFETNVGYGTPAHEKALRRLGPTSEHRMRWRPVRRLVEEFMGETACSTS